MARVNVDSQALTDARFAVLANLMGSDDPDFALGRMIRVWMQCYERGTYAVTKQVIVALFRGAIDAPRWLVEAELAEEIDGALRIKGTKGRIEYLMKKRATAVSNGKSGGRPPGKNKKPTSVPDGNPDRGTAETPPAPAPAPALKDKYPPNPPPGGTVEKAKSKTSRKSRTPKPKAPKEPRERNPLFDALSEVSGLDPATAGEVIGTAAAACAKGDPPYTPDEVREFGKRFWEFCPWAARDNRPRPTPHEVAKNIGLVRSGPGCVRPVAAKPAKSEGVTDYAKRTALDLFPRKD